jgi:hypothetical protein
MSSWAKIRPRVALITRNRAMGAKIHREFVAMWPAFGWVELWHGTPEGHSLLRVHPDS